MTKTLRYAERAADLIGALCRSEGELICEVGRLCGARLAEMRLIHVFGAGHSHMLAEEAFHRAGGLVPVNGLLLDWLMVHDPGRRAGPLERTSGLAAAIWHNEPLEANDVVIVASNSGINPAPVEVAEAARDRGATVVAITSRAHSMAVTPRTRNGMRLLDVADYVVDTHAPIGDACVALNGGQGGWS